jgi:hypothetical protein
MGQSTVLSAKRRGLKDRDRMGRQGGEIPITDNTKIHRNLVDNGTPFAPEMKSASWLDIPIATQQLLAL